MDALLTDKQSIINWLDNHNIKNYTLIEDSKYGYVVDVDGSVNLTCKNLKSIDIKFKTISGNFNCSNNYITSLEGCPTTVGGHFSCDDNQLTNLEGVPTSVAGYFSCMSNQLTTLKGGPTSVGDNFYFYNNPLLGAYQNISDFAKLKAKIVSDTEQALLSKSLHHNKRTILHKV